MRHIPIALLSLLCFSLHGDEVKEALGSPHIVWSNETNSLRSGVSCMNRTLIIQLPDKIVNNASFALLNESSNKIHYFLPRDVAQRWDIQLVDSNGVALPMNCG